MTPLALSSELFAGAIINLAIFASGTSDPATKPASGSGLWLELATCEKVQQKAVKVTEDAVVPGAMGWESQKREYTIADMFEVTTRATTGLYNQLQFGLASPIVAGTAQTPFVTTERKVSGWVKIQLRQHIGTDRYVLDMYCDIRISGDPPPADKATQKPNMEFYVRKDTTLNAWNLPS